jgi:predicted nucleotidyltransferase
MAAIRRYAKRVAEKFSPQRIILFGSFAYGVTDEESDVDLLVVMAARNHIDQAIKIRFALDAPFPLDLIVRTSDNLAWRLAEGDCFLHEMVTRGKILYESADGSLGSKSRSMTKSAFITSNRLRNTSKL